MFVIETWRPPAAHSLIAYQLAVYERLLTRFPEAFNSVPNLLTELLDHTYRRGGRTVTITVDYNAHELTFQDDGPGVADPTELFPAKFRRARAGRAPAGIGLVILLHRATQVEITARTASDSWRAVLTDACLRGMPITTTPIEPTGTTGLTLHAKLPNTASLPYSLTPNVQKWFLTPVL